MSEVLTPRSDAVPRPSSGPATPSGLRRLAAISASLVGTYAVTSALGLLFWLVAARQFPLGSVGVAGASIAAMTLLGTLGTCGLGTLLIARLPLTEQSRRRLTTRTALAVAGVVGLLLAGLVPPIAIHVLGVGDLGAIAGQPGPAALFAVGTGLVAVSIVLDQAVLVLGNGTLQLERNALASGAKLVALVALSFAGPTGGMTIFLAWTIGTLVSLPWVAWRTRGGRALAAPGPLLDRSAVRGLAGPALSHHALNTSLQAPLQLLPLLVLVGVSAEGNGVFTTALQVTGVVFALPFAISVALFASADGRERDVLGRMRLTVPLSLAISLVANLALWVLAEPLLALFGAQYSEQGVDVLRLLALAGLPFVVKDHYVALRRVQGRTTHATGVLVGLALVELAAAAIGMRLGGVTGLCAWWLGALLLETLVLGWPLLRAVQDLRDRDEVATPAVAITAPVATPPATTPTARPAPRPVASRLRRLAGALGPGPAVLLMALGLPAVARAVTLADGTGTASGGAQALYVLGLAVIFAPAAVGSMLPRVLTPTRVVLVVAMMVLLQLTRLVVDPVRFVRHDELSHVAGLHLIEGSGRLYGDNPLLPVTAYYPGLQVATDAVHDLTGLGDHTSGVVVLVAARVVLALAVLLVVARITGSMRIGAVAVVLYACNLQMLAFNAQFSYQTLALPLAALTVHLVLTRRAGSRAALVPAVLAVLAVVASHHLTAMLLVAALVAWAVLERVLRRGDRSRAVAPMLVVAAVGAVGLAATLLVPGNPLAGYLGAIADSSASAVEGVTGGGEKTRALFQNAAGVQSAPWERAAIVVSLVVTLLALLLALWRARVLLPARTSVVVLLLLVALLFPLIPAGHLTAATAEVGDRSAGFVYLGVAFVVAWWLWQRPARVWRAWLFGVVATVVFLGSVVLGAGSIANQLPGAFRVSDDARSVDADNLAAVDWMSTHLPPGSVVYGDRVGGRLAGAYAGVDLVTHIGTDLDASRLLLDPAFGPEDLRLVREAGVQYLMADRRDANGLPNQGVYIESGEFGEADRTAPVPAAALRKFSDVPGVDVLYDNGSIVIYDLEALDAD